MKIGVIGAGIAGLSSAKYLHQKGHEVVVFDKNETSGGLVRCDWVNEFLYHRIGGHVFNSKFPEVLDWFWQFFDREKEFVKAKRNAKILLSNGLVGYPIENYLYQLPTDTVKEIVTDILSLQKSGYREPSTYSDFKAFLRGNFGDTLYELYFQPYNEKIWQCDLQEVSMEWLEGKLPMPRYEEMLTQSIIRREESKMVHSSFFYPLNNGSQFIVNRLSEGLTIEQNYEVTSLKKVQSEWIVNQIQSFDHLIYTGDVRYLSKLMTNSSMELSSLLESVQDLKVHGTSNVLCESDPTDVSWLYLPESHLKAHRIIYTGNFSPNNNPEGKLSCVVEYTGQLTQEEMIRDLKQLPGNLRPIEFNYEAATYVIQDLDTRAKIGALKKSLAPLHFDLLGRFAEWEYYNMDVVINEVINRYKNY